MPSAITSRTSHSSEQIPTVRTNWQEVAEDIVELRLLTVGDHTGPVDYVNGTLPEGI